MVKTEPSARMQDSLYKKQAVESDTTNINILVMTGQSNGSPSNVPEVECYWGRDEHPLLKEACEREV